MCLNGAWRGSNVEALYRSMAAAAKVARQSSSVDFVHRPPAARCRKVSAKEQWDDVLKGGADGPPRLLSYLSPVLGSYRALRGANASFDCCLPLREYIARITSGQA